MHQLTMSGEPVQEEQRSNLRIWQQNLNKSKEAQLDLLSAAKPSDWDLILIQEPYLDNALNNTRANHHWVVHYPPTHRLEGQARTRSLILINKSIPSDSYKLLPIFSPDVTGIELTTDDGRLTLFNIYNSCSDNASILTLQNYLIASRYSDRARPNDHMYWMGDFNRHHPLWEEERNSHLESPEDLISPLLDLIADFDMTMTLPAGIPTLQAMNSGNWTRPDNVWRSDSPTDLTIICNVAPELRPPKTDHLPIVTVIDTSPPIVISETRRAFKNVDWAMYREKLEEKVRISAFNAAPMTPEDLDAILEQIETMVTATIEETIPLVKQSPYMKRWWNPNLTKARREKNRLSRLSFKWRGNLTHPTHREHAKARRRYTELMRASMEEHWFQFLGSSNSSDLWTASRYISNTATDGGQTRIPELRTGPNPEDVARSNDEKAQALAKTFFIPKDPHMQVPQATYLATELSPLTPYSKQRILNKANTLKRNKAPGPDGIPNEVWIHCATLLIDPITTLFNGAMNMGYYPKAWRTSTTVVIRKPGKPAYDTPKAYRPIALLNTLGKLFSALIADDLSYLCDANQLLSERAYGGRAGRVTSDAIHVITHRVKDAWRNNRVASVLFLDIQAAFPNLVPERLVYDMQMMGIPPTYTTIITSLLSNRTTHLRFDDHTSSAIPIDNGSDQGNPLSVVLYNIYHSGLTKTPKNKREDATGYVDDATLYAEGANFEETNRILKDMMERENGALQWSRSHASPFETTKLAVMHFSASKTKSASIEPLVISTVENDGRPKEFTVGEAENYKYLGILINKKLSWSPHHSLVQSRAVSWTNLFRRLVRKNKGLSYSSARLIYNAVAVARINYACDVWYNPRKLQDEDDTARGSKTITRKLTSIQRQATIAITGALRSTAADTLEVHAGVLPVRTRLSKLCALSAARISTLTTGHPLHSIAKNKAKRRVKRHPTALHCLFHSTGIQPDCMEKIAPTRRPPSYRPIHSTRIDPSKEEAIRHDAEVQDRGIRVYSDGSGYRDGIGAAAVLYDNGRELTSLRYHLGSSREHTVFEGEIVGILLGLQLIAKSCAANNGRLEVSISLDNTSPITALNDQKTKPSQYLLDWVHKALNDLDEDLGERIQVKWVPGHMASRGNEAADREAKRAAMGDTSEPRDLPAQLRQPIPTSLSATRQALTNQAHKMWEKQWKKSKRYTRSKSYVKKPQSRSFGKIVKKLRRNQTSLLIQLRSNHIPLNFYLHRIKRVDDADCPHCPGQIEDIRHYLFNCRYYARPRQNLREKLGRKAASMPYLFSKSDGVKGLLKYVHETKRFQHLLGPLWNPEDEDEENPNPADVQNEDPSLPPAMFPRNPPHPPHLLPPTPTPPIG